MLGSAVTAVQTSGVTSNNSTSSHYQISRSRFFYLIPQSRHQRRLRLWINKEAPFRQLFLIPLLRSVQFLVSLSAHL